MGSFSRTAEQKAAPHLAKGKKTNKRDKGKKYCTMVGFQPKAAALLAVLATSQCLANDESPISSSQSAAQVSHSAYFTEMMVQSPSLEPAKCSDKVLEARKTATVTQGVKPWWQRWTRWWWRWRRRWSQGGRLCCCSEGWQQPREEIEQSESCAWQSTLNLEKKMEKQIRREPSEFKDQFNNAEIFDKRQVGRDFVERTCFVYDWLSG